MEIYSELKSDREGLFIEVGIYAGDDINGASSINIITIVAKNGKIAPLQF